MTAHHQYRPCPLPARAAGVQASPDLLRAAADDVHQHADVGRGRRGLRRRVRRASARSGSTPATATGTGTSTPGPAPWTWRSRSCGQGTLLPGLAAGAPPPGRGGADLGGGDLLPARGLDPADGEAGASRWASPGCPSRRSSVMAKDLDAQVEDVPHPPAGRRPVHVRGRRRAGAEGPRGRPGRQRARAGRDRGERRRAPGDPRPAGHHQPRTAPAGWRSSAT